MSISTKIMKSVSLAALLLGVVWRSSSSYQTLLQFLVCAGAILVVVQAMGATKYLWAVGFGVIAMLYNPVVPLAPARSVSLNLFCLVMFTVSLVLIRAQPVRARLLLARSKTNPSSRVTTVWWS